MRSRVAEFVARKIHPHAEEEGDTVAGFGCWGLLSTVNTYISLSRVPQWYLGILEKEFGKEANVQ